MNCNIKSDKIKILELWANEIRHVPKRILSFKILLYVRETKPGNTHRRVTLAQT